MSKDLLADVDDELMLVAINVVLTKVDGTFDSWLAETIRINGERIQSLVLTMMDVESLISNKAFPDMWLEFVNSGRMKDVLTNTNFNSDQYSPSIRPIKSEL